MTRKLNELLLALEKEEKVVRKRVEENRIAFNEVSKSALTSWSAAGERDYAEGQAKINQDYHSKVLKLIEEVKEAHTKDKEKVSSPGFVLVQTGDTASEFFVVDEPINLDGMKLVSKDSPLGNSVLGKTEGESFEYLVGGKKVKGEVLQHD